MAFAERGNEVEDVRPSYPANSSDKQPLTSTPVSSNFLGENLVQTPAGGHME